MAHHTPPPTRCRTLVLCLAMLLAPLTACVQDTGLATNREADKYLQQGQDLIQRGLTDDALAAFERAIEHNPNLTEAHLRIGHIHRHRGNLRDAGASYDHAGKTNPNSFDAHYYLGLMRQMTGRISHAVRSYLRAISIRPDNFAAHQHLASAYLQLRQPADALPYALIAVELKHDDQGAWANLAATHSLLGDHRKAIDAYREALELGEMADPILLGLANSHARLKHYEQAKIVLESLQKHNASSAPAHERMGWVWFKMRRFDRALNSYEMALTIDRNDTSALNGKGVCLMTRYLRSGRADHDDGRAALQVWRRSLKLRPAQPRIVSLLTRYQRL